MTSPRGLRSRILSILVLVVTIGLAVSGLSAAGAAIRLSRVFGPPTTATVVTGTGFGGSEQVDVRFDGTVVASATTDGSGAFSARIKVPRPALPGAHTVKAVGRTTRASARATFTVRTDWTQFHFTPSLTGLNPYKNVLKPSNISQLNRAWVGINMGGVMDFSSPAVTGGVVYSSSLFPRVCRADSSAPCLCQVVEASRAVRYRSLPSCDSQLIVNVLRASCTTSSRVRPTASCTAIKFSFM